MPDNSVDYGRDTALAIGNLPLPAAAMRGLTGELSPIDNGPIIEMLDFDLDDQTVPSGQLYEGTLTTSDQNAPPVFGTFKGFVLAGVDFPEEIQEALALFPDGPTRPPVPGSLYYTDAADALEVPANDAPNRGALPAAAFRNYRPRFARLMVVEPWKLAFDEYLKTWGLTLKWRELPPEEQAA